MTDPQQPSAGAPRPTTTPSDVDVTAQPGADRADDGAASLKPALTTDEQAQRDDLLVEPGNS